MGVEKIKVCLSRDDIVMRDPRTKVRLTTEPVEVPKNAFWLRRIKDGDVVLCVDERELDYGDSI